ncbi:hypothetical protein I3842_02G043300 [Carya illinoinensis]|uniref:Uncharacterized protein n=1 Tax=Carya illinoinensis TaxID=32201 RepID=A0A922FUA1_CARIL|nr:hypothetical protein I3842_02G043300 [Carya illinoinensis]
MVWLPSVRPPAGPLQQPQSQEPTPRPSAVVSPAARGAAPIAQVPALGATLPVAPTSLVPSSPTPRASAPIPSVTFATARVPSPIQPPKTIQPIVEPLPQSPKPKSTAPPPSALTILPSQLKSQGELEQKIPTDVLQKDVVVRKTIGKKEVSKENKTKEMVKSSCKNILDLEEVGMRVITISGENRGAFMKVIQSASKKHEVVHRNENPKTESHGNDWENSTSSDEAVGNLKKDKSHKGKVTSSMPMRAFVNSNVQSINNSILYNSSCTHNDPGVHLDFSSN